MAAQTQTSRGVGRLIRLLSYPEGSLNWALGMRQEIQVSYDQPEVDHAYTRECLHSMLRSRGWQQLTNAEGAPFRSFIDFCRTSRPEGLGLTQSAIESFID